ncbi:alkaline phosphatase D family protein [Luteolibacter pohnpeiensis]|uniref:Alkaline phosphatase D family protein n=1 Tax=Luteolibacter pohnpeiensis TaxID=454153 RepID=A0A934VQL0_9BACT|nr:alkaline phosphatase D family protein [Luteolibacter pohnpeiensis]MBK1882201.1 alkaline phosphatase D family protein [Luteolibacter pohnpeiensis]
MKSSTSPVPQLYPQGSPSLSRRTFLGGSASLIFALTASKVLGNQGFVRNHPTFPAYPFSLGVASGDPTADGFVLWTRLAPIPLMGGGMPNESVLVHWRVAEDEAMTKVVASGSEVASPDWAHSVHVEVEGLKPDRWYWYEFKAGSEISPRARTRTMCPLDTPAEKTTPIKMTFASCQHYETGHYTAYEHMLAENPDIVFHLGDYIYENKGREDLVRKHIGNEIMVVDDYRNRHAQYKTDPALQAMHHAAPWVVTWDDHEVDNNYAGDISEKLKVKPESFLKRRAAAYQAYYEHMPIRRSAMPTGPDMQIYRTISHGQLVNFQVLDTRQFRTDQPNGDGLKTPGEAAMRPDATILGTVQKKWLDQQLGNSNARWNVLAQQVMMARVDRAPGEEVKCAMDQWPGYEMDRRRVLQSFRDLKVSNPVVITGDIHSHWANDLVVDFEGNKAETVAVEFVGTSISSAGDGIAIPEDHETVMKENSCVKFYNKQRGYVSCQIDPKRWHADYQNVDYVSRPGAPLKTTASFVVEDKTSGLQIA